MSETSWSNEWIEMARMDLRSAEFLLDMRPLPIEIVCFHCEQAAEKMLKGALVARDKEPPRTHDLSTLCGLCAETDAAYDSLLDSCVELTPYGVQARYPSQLDIEESDMERALRECRKIFAFVEKRLSEQGCI